MNVGEMVLLDGLLGADMAWIVSFITFDGEETETIEGADGFVAELIDGPHEGRCVAIKLGSVELRTRH